jgi:hypothetical protein
MIDVYAPSDLLPSGSDRRIGEELTRAVLRAEGVSAPGPLHLENIAAFNHRMDPATLKSATHAVARAIRGTAYGREEFAALVAAAAAAKK